MFLTIKLCTYAKLIFFLNKTIYIKMDLVLNNPQRLICHKTQPTNQPTIELSSLYYNHFRTNILEKV